MPWRFLNGFHKLLHAASATDACDSCCQGTKTPVTVDELALATSRDTSKRTLWGCCVARCRDAHGMGIQCGRCLGVCP